MQKANSHHDDLDESIIQIVNQIIQEAILLFVSDIHIEPFRDLYRIRYRCDGILREKQNIATSLASRFIARLKVLAQLDMTEKRLPQDGRFQLFGIDIRMSSCPTFFGEKIVLRLLDSSKISLNIEELGFLPSQHSIFMHNISHSHGLILVTGPTGSGKTVTLYSALQYRNTSEINIATAEDPIEMQLNGINQVNINPKIGLDFPNVLRALLRQDPDIIMIGEIRDKETAEIAVQAANTGHLVFATLHTNSAMDAIGRLCSLGISHYYIEHAVSLILGQRLLRKLCENCKKPNLVQPELFDADSCDECLDGYKGRIGVYECLSMTEDILEHLANRHQLKSNIRDTLQQSAREKLRMGQTSLSEIKRVLHS